MLAFLSVICFVQLLLLLLFARIYVYPFFIKRFVRKSLVKNRMSVEKLESLILAGSMRMLSSKTNFMSMHETSDFYTELIRLRNASAYYREARYFFPRAFLLFSLCEYAKSKNNSFCIRRVEQEFSFYLSGKGRPTFKVDRVDQVVFGLASLSLYEVTREDKYRAFSKFFYQFLLEQENEDHIIFYRKNVDYQYVDVLGMIVPFLIKYYAEFKDERALQLALHNLHYYIDNGVDIKSGLPFHAFSPTEKLCLGPQNWGRGMIWYYLALAFVQKHVPTQSQKVQDALVKLEQTLRTLNSPYSQFLGMKQSFISFDSSVFAGTWFVRRFLYHEDVPFHEILPFVSKDGFVTECSGDTLGVNFYSKSTSCSEFAQSMLLFTFI